MKTLGKILIILVVFAVAMGITYFAVNASGSSSNDMPQFENRERPFPANGQFEPGEGQEFPGGEFEGRERHEGGGGMMFGLIKNIGIITILVAIIVVPKSLNKRKRLQASSSTGDKR